jgi:hypothetical protein
MAEGEGCVSDRQTFEFRLACYLLALTLVSTRDGYAIATLQGRARAMRMLIGIEIELGHP